MARTLKQFKARALARPGVKKAYDDLAEEFAFIDEVLKARSGSGLTQAEVPARIGTTQSAIEHGWGRCLNLYFASAAIESPAQVVSRNPFGRFPYEGSSAGRCREWWGARGRPDMPHEVASDEHGAKTERDTR